MDTPLGWTFVGLTALYSLGLVPRLARVSAHLKRSEFRVYGDGYVEKGLVFGLPTPQTLWKSTVKYALALPAWRSGSIPHVRVSSHAWRPR